MKTKLHKITILFLSLFMICGLNIMQVSALQDHDVIKTAPNKSETMNEFDSLNRMIKDYERKIVLKKAKSDEILTYEKLVSIKRDYISYLYSMKNLSKDELIRYNYTENQINALQNYDGSDEMSSRAAATVTGTLSKSEYVYNSSQNKTYLTAKYVAKWNGKPYYKHDDIMAVAIAGSEAGYFHSSKNFTCNKAGGNGNTNIRWTVYNGAGVSVKFKIADPQYSSEVFSQATLTYRGVAGGKVTVSGIAARYLHWELLNIGSANFSIGVSGPSISFTIGDAWTVESSASKTCYL